jgi:hypothetical protein
MSIDFNNYLEAAFHNLKETIAEAHKLVCKIWEEDPCRAHEENRNELEVLLNRAAFAIELMNSYDFMHDRFERLCYGWHPGRYSVQCKLCGIERSCYESATTTGQIGCNPPHPCPPTAGRAILPPVVGEGFRHSKP